MKSLLFVTNLPSPYRVNFFNELSKYFDVSVIYERATASNRDPAWVNKGEIHFHQEYLNCKEFGEERSIGLKVVKYIKENSFDYLFFGGYSSPSIIFAILYAQMKKIKYYIECDGGFFQKDTGIKYRIKKKLIKEAEGIFITCEEEYAFFEQYGVDRNRIYKYPFTSLYASDIIAQPIALKEKKKIRKQLCLFEERILISVGRIIPGKGFDTLIKAKKRITGDVGLYIIGGEMTQELKQLIIDQDVKGVHFVPFISKGELKKYYSAADLFVLATRADVWGLVVNEAMSCGLPVITTNKCGAGVELIEHGYNGYLVDSEDYGEIAHIVNDYFNGDDQYEMPQRALVKMENYTFEKMALAHKKYLEE